MIWLKKISWAFYFYIMSYWLFIVISEGNVLIPDLINIFGQLFIWFGWGLCKDGENKRNLALYNQEARREWRETDFDEVWDV